MDELYAIRMRRALLCSVLLHALLFLPFATHQVTGGPGIHPNPEPLLLRLEQTAAVTPRQLVEVTEASELPPPAETDLIAEENSVARDQTLREGKEAGPRLEEEDPFDSLTALEPSVPPLPATPPVPTPETKTTVEEPSFEPLDTLAAEENPEYEETPPQTEPAPDLIAMAAPEVPFVPEPDSVPDRSAVPAPRPVPVPKPGQAEYGGPVSKGRSRDAVREMGLMNFEAIADQVAPYLKQVKQRVERRWNEALLNRYSGLTPTEAVVECAIAPDGTVVSATFVGTPTDSIFAAICRDAIVKAGPFGPFTFAVPDIYRNQNLEIRWTFSFL